MSKNNCAESMRLSRADNPVQGREENPAGSIAERDHEDRENCPAVPQTCHPEVKHVGHTVFRPAEDEYHHAEEEGEIFAKLMGITLISLDSNINEDVAEDTQQKQTQEAIVQLDLTEGCRLFVHSRPDTGQSGTAGRAVRPVPIRFPSQITGRSSA